MSKGGRKQPSIYLSELGPRRVVTQLKWFISTIIVAVSGLAIIGVVIFSSMHGGDGSGSVLKTLRRDTLNSMKPRAAGKPSSLKETSAGTKSDRLVVSAKGTTTRSLIYDRIERKKGAQDFISTKPYAKLTATLATERPEEEITRAGVQSDGPVRRRDARGA